jgi:gamma-glutamyltranspeptidase/glutathione hydrolase
MIALFRRVSLSQWIIAAMVVGVLVGWQFPSAALKGKVIYEMFLNLIKCIIVPLIFSTLVAGIASHANDLKSIGRLALKSIIYFEVITTAALVIGMAAVNLAQPGAGIQLPASPETSQPASGQLSLGSLLGRTIPHSLFDAAARNDVLQVVVFAILFGLAVAQARATSRQTMLGFFEPLSEVMFKFTGLVMYFAPFGVAAAVAYTIASNGIAVLLGLGKLTLTLYAALVAFIGLVLVPVMWLARIPVVTFFKTIRAPALLAFSTASSEAALPDALRRMENFGVPRRIVSFVVPAGYSFNLDGTALYLSLGAIFVAQAAGMHLSVAQQLPLLLTLMLTSKGAAGVPRAGIVVLSGTLVSFGLPASGVAVLLGIDAFLDMGRTAVNLIGNCLAAVVMARWEGELTMETNAAVAASQDAKKESGSGLPHSTTLRVVPGPRDLRSSWTAAVLCRFSESRCAPASLVVTAFLAFAPFAHAASTHGVVASVHPLATEAGLNTLTHGGNAIDATVAVALTLGVVDTQNSGLGGGCFMLIHRADGSLIAIDGRETAPAAATRDMFVRNGKADTELSQTGALTSGVPGSLAAYAFAVKQYGRKQLKDLLLPAAKIAEEGFPLGSHYASSLNSVAKDLARFESSRAVFLQPNGKPFAKGQILKQPDLAATYRHIAGEGTDWFYGGPFAKSVETWMKQNGGLLTADDFRNYKIILRQPLETTYRGYTIIGFPPPSSGGVHVAQILNILEKFDLKNMGEPLRLHVIAEAMKLAFADRAYWLGDPEFAKVPRGLVDKQYAAELAAKIDKDHVTKVSAHGQPPAWETSLFKGHTTHFSVADAEGNWVACTATINTSFGSKVVVPGTGVVLNNQMDDFSIQPGVVNFFGLLGAEANAVAPGKRPLSSMSPTIVLKDGKPLIALGAAGGPTIISAVTLELIDMLDLGLSPQQAVSSPRIHQQWFPDELAIEKGLSAETKAGLTRRGHKLHEKSAIAVSQVVARDKEGNGFVGAADPRSGGKAEAQ